MGARVYVNAWRLSCSATCLQQEQTTLRIVLLLRLLSFGILSLLVQKKRLFCKIQGEDRVVHTISVNHYKFCSFLVYRVCDLFLAGLVLDINIFFMQFNFLNTAFEKNRYLIVKLFDSSTVGKWRFSLILTYSKYWPVLEFFTAWSLSNKREKYNSWVYSAVSEYWKQNKLATTEIACVPPSPFSLPPYPLPPTPYPFRRMLRRLPLKELGHEMLNKKILQ